MMMHENFRGRGEPYHPLGCRCRKCARPEPLTRQERNWAMLLLGFAVGIAINLAIALASGHPGFFADFGL